MWSQSTVNRSLNYFCIQKAEKLDPSRCGVLRLQYMTKIPLFVSKDGYTVVLCLLGVGWHFGLHFSALFLMEISFREMIYGFPASICPCVFYVSSSFSFEIRSPWKTVQCTMSSCSQYEGEIWSGVSEKWLGRVELRCTRWRNRNWSFFGFHWFISGLCGFRS